MPDKQSEVRVSRKTSYYLKVGNQPELRRVMARQPSVEGHVRENVQKSDDGHDLRRRNAAGGF